MELSRTTKVVVILATLLMPLYLVIFMSVIFFNFGPKSGDSVIFRHFNVFFAIHLSMIILQFVLFTFYIVYLFKTRRMGTELKALWAIVLFMGAPIAMPIFWYLYIWREPQVAAG